MPVLVAHTTSAQPYSSHTAYDARASQARLARVLLGVTLAGGHVKNLPGAGSE